MFWVDEVTIGVCILIVVVIFCCVFDCREKKELMIKKAFADGMCNVCRGKVFRMQHSGNKNYMICKKCGNEKELVGKIDYWFG